MKRLMIFILIAILFLPQGIAFSHAADEDETPQAIPEIILDGHTVPEVSAGETLDFTLSLKNTSIYSARNIIVTPLFEETEGSPFVLETSNMKRTIDTLLKNKNSLINFKLKISDLAQAKTYALKVKIDFKNVDNESFTTTETVYINVIKQKSLPSLTLSRMELSPEKVEAGEAVQLILYLKNNGNLSANNVQFSIDGLQSDGFTVVNGGNNKFFKEIPGSSEAYSIFDLQASTQITDGNHSLSLNLSYQDPGNNDYTDELQFFLPVGDGGGSIPQLEIQNIQSPSGDMSVNDSFDISFDVANLGQGTAKNVKVTVDGQEALLPRSQNTRIIQNIAGNETSSQNFSFNVASDAAQQNHPLLITVEYDKGSEETKETMQQYVGINVAGGSGSSTPKIIIDQYSFQPQIIRAGENFDLSISFLNTNAGKAVENVKIFFNVDEETEEDGSVFTPVNSSNTFYIDYIGPKESVQKNLTMYAVPNADPRTYTIAANFEYEDASGEIYTATELIGIPVVQQSRLEVSDFTVPSETFVGQELYLYMDFYNMGKVTLNNLMIKVEGNFETRDGSYYVGNFDSGYSDYFEAAIIPTAAGPIEGQVTFSYEDSAGEPVEIIRDFTSTAMEMPQPDDMGTPGEMPVIEEPPSLVGRIFSNKILWGAIVVGLGIGGFFLRKRMKKKKGMAEDEVY